MAEFIAPYYTEEQIEELGEENLKYPFSDKDATYKGREHQYELTSKYFEERGRNLQVELEGNSPDKVKNFLEGLRRKVYLKIYSQSKTSRNILNYIIAKRGIYGFTPFEYRQAFLEMMFIEGEYLLDNGDISSVAGVDLDTMQNMSEDVMRNQERDFHKDCISAMRNLGLRYFGRYKIIPQGTQGKDW